MTCIEKYSSRLQGIDGALHGVPDAMMEVVLKVRRCIQRINFSLGLDEMSAAGQCSRMQRLQFEMGGICCQPSTAFFRQFSIVTIGQGSIGQQQVGPHAERIGTQGDECVGSDFRNPLSHQRRSTGSDAWPESPRRRGQALGSKSSKANIGSVGCQQHIGRVGLVEGRF